MEAMGRCRFSPGQRAMPYLVALVAILLHSAAFAATRHPEAPFIRESKEYGPVMIL